MHNKLGTGSHTEKYKNIMWFGKLRLLGRKQSSTVVPMVQNLTKPLTDFMNNQEEQENKESIL